VPSRIVACAGGSGVLYGTGVRWSKPNHISVGVVAISGSSDVTCGVEEQAAGPNRINTAAVVNRLNILEFIVEVTFSLSCLSQNAGNRLLLTMMGLELQNNIIKL
jgi:hypothetical protein